MGFYSAEERETFIHINYYDNQIEVFTNYPAVMKRMRKAGYSPATTGMKNGEVVDSKYIFPIASRGRLLRVDMCRYSPGQE